MSVRCFNPRCGQPYHEATGHQFIVNGERIPYCGSCYRYFMAFIKSHTKRKWGGMNFYEEAATSIREGVYPPK